MVLSKCCKAEIRLLIGFGIVCSKCRTICELENDNKLTAEDIYIAHYGVCPSPEKKILLHTFFDMIEFAINYEHYQSEQIQKQKYDLIKQNESLSQVIDSQNQTMDALIKKYEELQKITDGLAEQLRYNLYYHANGQSEDLDALIYMAEKELDKYNKTKQ